MDHPEKLKYIDPERDTWISPEEVAEAMLDCVDGDMVGGTIVEVTKGKRRKVEAFNDPGPTGDGSSSSGINRATDEVFGWLGSGEWGVSESEKK